MEQVQEEVNANNYHLPPGAPFTNMDQFWSQ